MQIGLGLWLGTRQVGGFNPAAVLFGAGEQGGWYDSSDLSTMFQDSAGTTPVTATGQTVGLLLDKSGRGNHLTQATAASRPIYGIEPFGGRRNLLVRTEEFDNAAWSKTAATVTANAIAAPDLTITADKLVETATLNNHRVFQGITTATNPYTCTAYFKKGERDWAYIRLDDSTSVSRHAWFNLASGAVGTVETGLTASITLLGDGWYRCQATITAALAGTSNILFGIAPSDNTTSYTGDGTSGIFIWGAQLETGSLATPYQRVTDQWNVTEAGVPSVSYVQYDGTDDFLVTGTITPGIDKAQVFAGVRKLSDAALGVLAETSATGGVGSVSVLAPRTSTTSYGYASRGSLTAEANTTTGAFPAPITNVLTGIGDIAADTAILRVNGVQVGTSAADQGTGNYLAYPLYVGRRGGTSLPFNGRLYQLLVRFGANLDASTIAATETFVNSRTGAYVRCYPAS